VASSSNSLSTIHPSCFLKRVDSFLIIPSDKEFFTGVGPWKLVLFHWSCIDSLDVSCVHPIFCEVEVQILKYGSGFDWMSFAHSLAHDASCSVHNLIIPLRSINIEIPKSGAQHTSSLRRFFQFFGGITGQTLVGDREDSSYN
jgi:hypothetical protein